jgi:hypothetical protein
MTESKGGDPGVPRSYGNARSAFGARRSDAELMRRIATRDGAYIRGALA